MRLWQEVGVVPGVELARPGTNWELIPLRLESLSYMRCAHFRSGTDWQSMLHRAARD